MADYQIPSFLALPNLSRFVGNGDATQHNLALFAETRVKRTRLGQVMLEMDSSYVLLGYRNPAVYFMDFHGLRHSSTWLIRVLFVHRW